MAEIVNIDIFPTIETVSLTVEPNLITINVNTVIATGAVTSVNGMTGAVTGLEVTANKQNSLAVDGTGTKYATVDAVNAGLVNVNTNAVDRVTVKLGEAITKGQAVYVSSASGTNIIVSKASNATEEASSKTLGLVETSGSTNAIVNVITSGLLEGVNTSTATIGDDVFLGVNGNLIFGLTNKPSAPAHLVSIGIVSRVNIVNGEIIVRIQNGFELQEIHNCSIVNPLNEDFLQYETSTSLWKNIQLTASWIRSKLGVTTLSGSNTGDQDLSGYSLNSNKQNSLTIDGTAVKYPTVDAVNNLSIIDKFKRGIQYFTDFENVGNATPYLSQFVSGTGATTNRLVSTIPNQTTNQIGFCQYQTGTTSTGYATHISEGNVGQQMQFGGGSWVFESSIELSALSSATDRYRFILGFGNAPTNGTETYGAFFTYDEGGTLNGTSATPNWQCVTSNNSVRTLTTTTVAVNITFNTLRIEVNAAGTSVVFKINGTTVATHTTNIPTGLSRFNVKQSIVKTIGTTNVSCFCDYLGYENNLTTAR